MVEQALVDQPCLGDTSTAKICKRAGIVIQEFADPRTPGLAAAALLQAHQYLEFAELRRLVGWLAGD